MNDQDDAADKNTAGAADELNYNSTSRRPQDSADTGKSAGGSRQEENAAEESSK